MSGESWHATIGGYTNHACRCPECRAAWSAYWLRRRNERHAGMLAGVLRPVHGKATTYSNYVCRCRPCTDAWAASVRARKQRRRERAA